MPEYTPSTNRVRTIYEEFASLRGSKKHPDELFAEFDRWLTEVIRENRAIGWNEGFEAGEQDVMEHNRTSWSADCIANPYRGDSQ